jgi:RND family efflux transporter MFP subunit
MIRQMILVATILAFVLLGSTGCQRAEAHPAEKLPAEELPAEEQEQDLTEEVDDLKALASETTPPQDPAVVTATGEMVAWIHSELVPRQAGRIGRILVDEGSVVRKGEALLKLETDYLELAVTAAQAEVARARAGLLEAERDLARKQGLLEKESISRAVYDRVEAGFEGARAAHELTQAHLALAEKRLDDAVLRSPIDGVVAERRVDVGESAGPTKVAFVIVRTRPLKLRKVLERSR